MFNNTETKYLFSHYNRTPNNAWTNIEHRKIDTFQLEHNSTKLQKKQNKN